MSTSKRSPASMVHGLETSAAKSSMSRLQELSTRAAAPARVSQGSGKSSEPGFEAHVPHTDYLPGARILLPVDLLDENPHNPRVFYSDAGLQKLIKSIARSGVLTAVQVYPAENGRYRLKSGHCRVRSVKQLGQTVIKAEVVPLSGDALQDYREAREINQEHRSHTHFDDAIRFQQLVSEGTGQHVIASLLGLTEVDVSKHLSIGGLPRDVLEAMAENISSFGFTSSYLIYRYWSTTGKDDDALRRLVKKVVEGKLSTRQLEQMVKEQKPAGSTGGPKRAQAFSRAELRGYGTGELKAFEGKLVLHLEKLENEKRDVLFGRILALFKEEGLEVGAAATPA